MRSIELEMSSSDNAERIVHLVWRAGRVETKFVAEEMRSALVRWLAGGVREWADENGGRVARITPSTDARFLFRLADDLRRQFNFSMKLVERDEPVVSFVRVQPPVMRRLTPASFVVSRDQQGQFVTETKSTVSARILAYEWHA